MADELLSVDHVKAHLRIVRDDEDDYLRQLVASAIAGCEAWTGRTLVAPDTLPASLVDDQLPLLPDIAHGLLMLIGHWYENREMTAERALPEIPAATHALWQPYVWHHLGDSA